MTADALMTPGLVTEAQQAIAQYAEARKRFRAVQDRLKEARLLVGNDNKVGIIGEFWAMQSYRARGFKLESIPKHTNNAGFDFVVRQGDVVLKISVKAITAENERGKTSRLKGNGNWDELCIVQMDENLKPLRFGRATHEAFCERCKGTSKVMQTDVRWLDQDWMTVWTHDDE